MAEQTPPRFAGKVAADPEQEGAHDGQTLELAAIDDEISKMALLAYRKASPLVRALQALRPVICPMGKLLSQIPPGSRILDVGCGAGLFLLAGISCGRVSGGCGIDVSERALAAARTALAQLGTVRGASCDSVTFESASDTGFPAGPFDVVSMIDVMHHVPPRMQQQFFAEAASRVRPNGVLLYKDMCRRPRWKAFANRLHDLFIARQWIHYVPLADIRAWAAACGLRIVRQDSYSRFWYGHELLVMRRG